MIPRSVPFSLVLLALAGRSIAEDQAPPVPAEVADQIRAAVGAGNYVALGAACERAKAARARLADGALEPIVRALGEGSKSRDASIALLSVRTLGEMGVRGSAGPLAALLAPPRKPAADRIALHLAAIEAAGSIGDRDCVSRLQKLLLHEDTAVAVASAGALGGVRWLDGRERIVVVSEVANLLGRMEIRRPSKQVDKVHVSVVKAAIVDSLRRLTGKADLSSADDFRAWARDAAREQRAVT